MPTLCPKFLGKMAHSFPRPYSPILEDAVIGPGYEANAGAGSLRIKEAHSSDVTCAGLGAKMAAAEVMLMPHCK